VRCVNRPFALLHSLERQMLVDTLTFSTISFSRYTLAREPARRDLGERMGREGKNASYPFAVRPSGRKRWRRANEPLNINVNLSQRAFLALEPDFFSALRNMCTKSIDSNPR
jgi:hypothetical protein